MHRELFPFQERALEYCLTTHHPALFMEMRLGKTLVTIRACKRRQFKRVLVVAPLSVLAVWDEELRTESEKHVLLIRDKVALSFAQKWQGWCLVNYEYLRHYPALAYMYWDAVVLDESTRIKNPKAQTTKLCCKGFRNVQARFLLSGLPAPESPMEFFPQFQFQTGGFLGYGNFWKFRERFFLNVGYEWLPRYGTVAAIRHEVQNRAFCLTRKEAGIGSRKVHERRIVEPTAEQRRLQKKAMKEYKLDESSTLWTVAVQTWLAEIAGGFAEHKHIGDDRKTKELIGLLNGDLRGEQVIVFFRFNEELERCHSVLSANGFVARAITGGTGPIARREINKAFQSGELQILLLQIKVARFGLNFSVASTAIYYSNSFSLEDRVQSEDRIVHPMKNEPLLYIDLVTRGTVDEDVTLALREKRNEATFFTSRLLELFLARARGENINN